MDVSIVLVSYNTRDLTRECIKSIYEKTEGVNFDIWVVDNASHDGSVQMIEEEFTSVRLIKSNENLGFGRANNLVIEQAQGKYVFLLNTDTVLLNNAIKILYDYMEKPENIDVAVCGGQLYNADMSLQGSYGEFHTIEKLYRKSIGINFDTISVRFNKMFAKKAFEKKTVQPDGNEVGYVPENPDYIIGADMMLRKSAVDKYGAFDERFFMYCEEMELCFRLRKRGYKIKFVPESRILHYGGSSSYSENTPIEVEKMILKGALLFYEIAYGKEMARKAKMLYIVYHLRYLPLRFFSPRAFARLKMAICA